MMRMKHVQWQLVMFKCIGYHDYIITGRVFYGDVYTFSQDTATVLSETDSFFTLNTVICSLIAIQPIHEGRLEGLHEFVHKCL